ncbi:MAG: DNA recombination/repair protein RecA, partial [Eubacteriales bacterium]
YNYGEDRIGQGRENAKKYLRDNPEVRDKVESEIRDILFDNDETESDEAKADSAPIEE